MLQFGAQCQLVKRADNMRIPTLLLDFISKRRNENNQLISDSSAFLCDEGNMRTRAPAKNKVSGRKDTAGLDITR